MNDHQAAIDRDIQRGLTAKQIRDEIISRVGMMADVRTSEMNARYDAALEREVRGSAWWAVSVEGFMPAYFRAPTKAKARFLAFKALREAGYVSTFRDFLDRLGNVRVAESDEVAVQTMGPTGITGQASTEI